MLDLDSGRAVMDGGAAGAPGTSDSGGRVTGRFTVPPARQLSDPARVGNRRAVGAFAMHKACQLRPRRRIA